MPAWRRKLCYLALLFACHWSCSGWDTLPHQQITRAALDAVPKPLLSRLASELKPLIDLYRKNF